MLTIYYIIAEIGERLKILMNMTLSGINLLPTLVHQEYKYIRGSHPGSHLSTLRSVGDIRFASFVVQDEIHFSEGLFKIKAAQVTARDSMNDGLCNRLGLPPLNEQYHRSHP